MLVVATDTATKTQLGSVTFHQVDIGLMAQTAVRQAWFSATGFEVFLHAPLCLPEDSQL